MIPIKNTREIEKMRQACRTASDILDRVRDLVRPGITTKDIDEAAADFMNGRISCCASPKMRSRVQLRLLEKADASATSALKSRMRRDALAFRSCANLLDTGWDEKCTRNRKFQITANVVAVRS